MMDLVGYERILVDLMLRDIETVGLLPIVIEIFDIHRECLQ